MKPGNEQDDAPAGSDWASGISVRKIRGGYSWTISVAAEGSSLEQMKAALAKTVEIDLELQRLYPDE